MRSSNVVFTHRLNTLKWRPLNANTRCQFFRDRWRRHSNAVGRLQSRSNAVVFAFTFCDFLRRRVVARRARCIRTILVAAAAVVTTATVRIRNSLQAG